MDGRIKTANRVTLTGLLVNVALTIFKFISGITGKSAALIADAVHSFSDISTDIVVLLGLKIASKPKDKGHDYGHGKVETLATVIIGFILFIIAVEIFWTGAKLIINSFQGQIIARPGWVAFYAAVISIAVKEWLYRYTVKAGKKINSQAVIANAWHHRSDAFSSIGTVIGVGGAILLGQKWRILDPLAAVTISAFIAKIAFSISWPSLNELLDASLSDEMEDKILETVLSVSGVKNPHNMRTRKIGDNIAIDIHIELDKSLNVAQAHNISVEVEKKLKDVFGKKTFISLHIEPLR